MTAPTPHRRRGPRLALARALLRSVGRLSDGLSLCFDEGLTSGLMLEYVYRNRPSGRLLVGRWMDARFLAAPGWQAVRERRALLETLLARAIAVLRAEGRAAEIVDIASGPAGYVREVLRRSGGQDVRARCRDLDERWLAVGRERAAAEGVRGVVYERGDALDRESLLALRPRPNLAISSGFYDWINDDEVVRRSIGIVADMLEPGGLFVLTHQTANPDLAFLNSVFTDFHHAPLVMTLRDAGRVNGWLEAAGLAPEETRTDGRSRYAVTLARRR